MAVTIEENRASAEPRHRRHMALVANARAGALLGQGDGAASLEEQVRAVSGRLDVIAEAAGDLPDRIGQAIATRAEIVVVAGGDGTIACAAAALAGTETALGLIPCGTMNLLAKDVGLDPADHPAAIKALYDGELRAIDAGGVRSGEESHMFLCASMLGTPARLSKHREAGRQRGNGVLAWANFGRAVTQAVMRNRSLRLTLRIGGRTVERRTPSLTIVVNKLDDASGRLFGRTCLDGGTLAIYIVRRTSVLRQAWLLLRTAFTGSLRMPDIDFFEATEVEIDTRHAALHVLIDGELRLLKPPLRYTIQPGALRVVAPAPGLRP
jgi:diacylglycerol kinase family enzyme